MEEFGRSARGYVAYLLGATQKLSRFTSDTVKGLGSFDLEILLVDPMDRACYCFKQLFTSFRLRGVVDSSEETVYAEEYLSFVDELRRLHPDMQQPKLLIADAVDFISGQEALKTRRHLNRIFRFSCLCLDEPRLSFPGVEFGSVKTDDPTCSMFDVVTPIQSFLAHGLRGMDILTSDFCIASFLSLEQSIGTTGLESTNSPRDSIDHFGRQQIREGFNVCRRATTGAESSRTSPNKSPKVVRISPGQSTSQCDVPETEEAPMTKPSASSGGSAKS